jgi:hypothetical protein
MSSVLTPNLGYYAITAWKKEGMKETNKQTARIAFLWLQISQYLG